MRIFSAVISVVFLLGILAYGAGLRVNFTPSMPRGLYMLKGCGIKRGDYVAYCLPVSMLTIGRRYLKSGSCPSRLQPLLKIAAALPGDRIEFTAEGIYINEIYMENSSAKDTDRNGRELIRITGQATVPAGCALILAPHLDSFDSRYFGLVRLSDLEKVVPVFTEATLPESLISADGTLIDSLNN
ncbi:MAG: conjugative transfer signal peptidase TraF [Desulfarculales bacterium]|jgi:conjugative transfer signal peptidase TraF|nr:conjugative transfer signal peptidase TraF [Desulfarculales bacterium]